MTKANSRLIQKLQLNKYKLSALLDITKAINSRVPTQELLDTYRNVVEDELGITKLILFLRSGDNWNSIIEYGQADIENKIDPSISFIDFKDITVLSSSSIDKLGGYDVLIPVYHEHHPLAYLMIGDLNEDEVMISPTIKHMNFIQTLTNILVVAIENKRLAKENLRQERIKRELELAAEMQSFLIPKELPSNNMVNISGRYLPHQETGGDYYDYIYLGANRFVYCIADVSGKGISAAFLMANFQAYLKALVTVTSSLDELIRLLNERVFESSRGEKFITFFIGVCDLNDNTMLYVNAGHNPPIHQSKNGCKELREGCVGLGMLDEITDIKVAKVDLLKGDRIICFTDGLVEMENTNEEEFGIQRVINSLNTFSGGSMSDYNDLLLGEFDSFREGLTPFDDLAILSICICSC